MTIVRILTMIAIVVDFVVVIIFEWSYGIVPCPMEIDWDGTLVFGSLHLHRLYVVGPMGGPVDDGTMQLWMNPRPSGQHPAGTRQAGGHGFPDPWLLVSALTLRRAKA